MNNTAQKICTMCKSLKNISEFRKDSRLKSGLGATCKPCSTARASAWNKSNSEKVKVREKAWREENKEYDSARKMEWAKRNPTNKKIADKKSYEKNKDRRLVTVKNYRLLNLATVKEKNKLWRSNNIGYVLAKNKERHALKLQRCPKWLTADDRQKIQSIYDECRSVSLTTGVLHHVDHEIPLQGKLVSGLHVPTNLRIIPAKDNLVKKNKYQV